jgi:hypothetical protein
MKESAQKAQQRYRQTQKGKEAARRASAKAAEKVRKVGISPQHKDKLKKIADHYNMSQKEIVENWIDKTEI